MTQEIPLLFRLIWFVFIGLPLGGVMTFVAWLSCITIVGLPIGIWIFDRLPGVMTLKAPEQKAIAIQRDGFYYIRQTGPDQAPLLVRLLYFGLVGWWFLLIWLSLAWALTPSIIGTPIAFWMFNRVPKVLWLTEV